MMHISLHTYIYTSLTSSDYEIVAHTKCSSLLLKI